MNEQIKRFSEQAINYATSKRPLPDLKDKELFLNNLFEKFAELIVQEMLKTCAEHPAWYGRMIADEIKQNFGVKE
jgi:hypothetical protein